MHLHSSLPHPRLPVLHSAALPLRALRPRELRLSTSRLPALHVPALLLSVVYAVAVAVAFTAPGQHAPAGVVVLTGLGARWWLRHRHRSALRARAADLMIR